MKKRTREIHMGFTFKIYFGVLVRFCLYLKTTLKSFLWKQRIRYMNQTRLQKGFGPISTCMASASVEVIIKTRLRVSRRLSDRLSVILLHSFMMESILEIEKDIRIISKNNFSTIILFLVSEKYILLKSPLRNPSYIHLLQLHQTVVNFF